VSFSLGAGPLARGTVTPASPAAKRAGIAAVIVSIIAWWLTLPPILIRSAVPSIIVGLAAAAAGAWVIHEKQWRLGGTAVVLGLVAIPIALVMTHQPTANVKQVFVWSALIASALTFTTPLLFAALGGIISERSGVVNIGLEGMMLTGAYFGIFGADVLHSWFLGCLVGMLSGALMALIHAWFSISMRADQVVSGTGINLLALGVTGYFFIAHYGDNGTSPNISSVPNVNIPGVEHVAFFGTAIGHANALTWVGLILVPLVWWFLFRTRWGLRLRAVGEQPRAASTVGLPVIRVRYIAVVMSGVLAALGGVYLSVGLVGSFNNNMTEGRGFIALAAVIFGKWNPVGALLATLLFGFSSALAYRLPTFSGTLATLFMALPYVLTLIAVAGLIGRSRAPASSGIPYVKE
jgi:ABC-type uncharacterized transport system permease subunit